jgi:hemoglobin
MTLYEKIGGRLVLMRLLHHFYADVRQHRLLRPVFGAHVHDWPAHLDKIGNFWSTMTGGPSTYSGAMPQRHMPLSLREEEFQAWLGLWEHNCRAWLSEEGASGMIARAHQIAARLRQFCGVSAQHSDRTSRFFQSTGETIAK